ncbi:MAG: universal stress protein [Desulfobacteraceae bacterium]|jgi:nucleotide-binding universal stress UspA family protein|nr:universal stress protein [Desulfobacteraceae bacterium]
MKIRTILFVTKFEDLSLDALHAILTLRQSSLDHVVFLTVIERDRVAMRRGTGYQKREEIRLRETANIRFIDWAEPLFEEGMEVGVYITVGSLVAEVIKAAGKEGADMIVIGRSTKGRFEQLYAGSDITELLGRTAVPVLVYKATAENAMVAEKPFERPLLAMNWSPASLRAVEYLEGMAETVGEVSVVHTASEKQLTGESAMSVQKLRKETRARLDEICERLAERGIRSRPHVYIGDPAAEIERAAKDCQATMILMGSSSKAGWKERWSKSIPVKIAEDSMFPTLLIPPAVG